MTTWQELTTALTHTIATLDTGTFITIRPHHYNPHTSTWMQAAVLPDTDDTTLLLPQQPDDNPDTWHTFGWTTTDGHTWETTLEWPTPTPPTHHHHHHLPQPTPIRPHRHHPSRPRLLHLEQHQPHRPTPPPHQPHPLPPGLRAALVDNHSHRTVKGADPE